jgi:hypothetical protein
MDDIPADAKVPLMLAGFCIIMISLLVGVITGSTFKSFLLKRTGSPGLAYTVFLIWGIFVLVQGNKLTMYMLGFD